MSCSNYLQFGINLKTLYSNFVIVIYHAEFDNPDSEPSQSDIPPWDEDITAQSAQGETRYKMSSSPRGLCIIINNENFEMSRRPVDNPNVLQICREELEDRPGTHKDASE